MRGEKLKSALPYAGLPVVGGALLFVHIGRLDSFSLLRLALIVIFGYIAAVRDAYSKRIANGLVIAMLAAWATIMTPILFLDTNAAIDHLADSALGFVISGGLFLVVYLISRKGLGGGDVKFMAAAGLYLGFESALSAMLYGTILAAVTGLALILFKKIGRKDTIPLAPFLYSGILLTVFL